jgi:hypothetical protein
MVTLAAQARWPRRAVTLAVFNVAVRAPGGARPTRGLYLRSVIRRGWYQVGGSRLPHVDRPFANGEGAPMRG